MHELLVERTRKVENHRDKTMRRGRERKTTGAEGAAEEKMLSCTGSCKVALDLQTGDRNRCEDTCQNIYKSCSRTNAIFRILLFVAMSFTD